MLNDHTVTVPTLTPAEVAAIKEAAKRAQDGNRRVRVQAMAGVAASLTPERVIALCEAWETLRELVECKEASGPYEYDRPGYRWHDAWSRARALFADKEG